MLTPNHTERTFSFIVINYNAYDFMSKCLKSIKRFCLNRNYEIILIDNASSDDSIAGLESEFQDVIFIKNKENYGFARACNQGIERARGELIILLNNDFEFNINIFDRIIEKFQKYENLGLLGFQLLNPDGTLQRTGFKFPTILRRILQLTIVPLIRKRVRLPRFVAGRKDQIVDYIKGALMIIPARIFHQSNFRFDENYFMYHEEMDFAYQIRKHGKICLLDPTPAGIHYGMHFEDVKDERIFLWRNKNLLYFYKKNYGKSRLFVLIIINIIIFSLKGLFSKSNSRQTYKKALLSNLEFL